MTRPPHPNLPALTPTQTRLLQQLETALTQALAQGNRQHLHQARQAVLRAAWRQAQPPALRTALRHLSWRMAGLRLGKGLEFQG